MNKNQKSTQTLLGQLKKGIADLFNNLKNADGDAAPDPAKSIENTTEGGAAITIETDSDKPAVGDQVYLAGTTDVPPAGDHVLTGDLAGTTITTDDAGIITNVSEPAAEPAPAAEAASQENAVDAEETTRQIEALATSVRSMQTLMEQMMEIQKANAEDLRSIKSTPFGKQVFPVGRNVVTGNRGVKPEKAENATERSIREALEKK